MSFLNRFLIEEDIQFECAGVVEYKNHRKSKEKNLDKNLKRFLKESNSDFIRHLVLSDEINNPTTRSILNNLKNLPTMMTHIKSERLECVQKEQYTKLYNEASNEGAQINYLKENIGFSQYFSRFQPLLVYKSIGDDIDDFYNRIKMNKINFTNKRLLTRSDIGAQIVRHRLSLSNLLRAPHSVKTFHLSMLSEKEERKMHSEETGIPSPFYKRKTLSTRNGNLVTP